MAAATMIRRGRPSANDWLANVSIFEEEREQVPIGLRLTVVEARPRALVTVQVYSPNCWSVREVTSRLLLTIGPCWVSSTEWSDPGLICRPRKLQRKLSTAGVASASQTTLTLDPIAPN